LQRKVAPSDEPLLSQNIGVAEHIWCDVSGTALLSCIPPTMPSWCIINTL
jgi:hypothetical protein